MRRALRFAIVVVMLLTQAAVVVETAAEGWRGASASAHVERGGTRLHYGHDGATCVGCAVRSLHAMAAAPLPEPPVRLVRVAATTPVWTEGAYSTDPVANGSRAPPAAS
jgi:hypothetical protein